MASLNGDVVVMRNGRSTSTVSIYNYPEHLNPFYEDDQHKRLRFWQVNKKGDGERRNSFSLGGIKDMWAFKSFRSKKKSSTLGINKTSESPPPLRREYQIETNNLFNSYDRRARYSSNGPTTNGNNNNFERNATYRSSLQNMHSTQDSPSGFGLNRNDEYRSTIQFGNRNQLSPSDTRPVPKPRRYVYGGSVTPQPSRNSEFGRGQTVLAHGSSQSSVSTNPFDSDDDDEESEQHVSNESGATSLVGKRTPRKKRRAPAPPVPIHSPNNNADPSSQTNQLNPTELRIEENLEIANLTAEIESFVKTSNEDETENIRIPRVKEVETKTEQQKTNGTIPKEKIIMKTSPNQIITKQFKPQQKPSNNDLHIREDIQIEEKPALPEKKKINQTIVITRKEEAPSKEVGHVECIHVHVESPRSTPERSLPSRVTSFKKEEKPVEEITAKTSFTLASPPTHRRDLSENNVMNEKITKTETESISAAENAKPKQNGILKESPTSDKPPIAAKPTLESNKTKINQNFAIIHKPSARTVLSSETEEIAVPKSTTVTTTITTTERTVIPVAKQIETNQKIDTVEEKIEKGALKKKPSKPSSSQKHVVFQTDEKTVETVKLPESSKVNENKESKINPEPASVNEIKTEIVKIEIVSPQTSSQTNNTNISTTISQPTPSTSSLKIVESREDVLAMEENQDRSLSMLSSRSSPSPLLRRTSQQNPREEFEALYRNRPASHMEWKQSTLAPLDPHVPPEKRRSVKDIIESINRSQRLLHAAANKDLPLLSTTSQMPPPAYSEVVTEPHVNGQTDNDLSQNLKTLDETQREIERIFEDITAQDTSDAEPIPSGSHNAQTQNTVDAQKPNNEEIFKKCRVTKEVYDYRETSPTTSNLDWNPVPKPKRSKNLSDQREH